MKKILGIVVLGLLLSGCETTQPSVNTTSHPSIGDYKRSNMPSSRSSDIKVLQTVPNNASIIKRIESGRCKYLMWDPTPRRNDVLNDLTNRASALGADGIAELNIFNPGSVKENCWQALDGLAVAFKYNGDTPITSDNKDEKPKKKKPKLTPDNDKIVPAGSGSGFFVSNEGHAITNYHVIKGCDINKLTFKGSQTEVKVLAVDKVNDIAILKSNAKPDVIFPVSNEDVSLLEDVIVAGFPLGKQISSAIKTHKGVVTALAGAGDNYSFFQTDAAINQGNSGGPIINQKGNVVGIAVATWVEEGVQGVHFGIKSSTLKTFASSNGLSFVSPNYRELSNKDLGKLITKGTVYVECHMTIAKIKKMIAQAENRKAFFKEHR
tara:strand:+ start:1577 stop:2713 length:1137 start_codon:yes stop_codon:yes gene_type:complete